MIERAGEQSGHVLERFEETLAEQRKARELVERERLAAVGFVASRDRLASELQRDELGDARCGERVGRGEGPSDAQRDEHAGDPFASDEWGDHRRAGEVIIGQADRRLRLHRRAAPPRLFDSRPYGIVSERIVHDVVPGAASRAIDEERQRVALTERRKRREPGGPLVGLARDLAPRDDRRSEQTAYDRRQRRFLTNDAVAGGAE